MIWKDQLAPEQLHVLNEINSRPGTLLIGDVGSGKTRTSLAAIEAAAPQYTIIIVPLTSIDVIWSPQLAQLDGYTIVRSWDEFKRMRLAKVPRLILLVHFQLLSKIAKYAEKIPWDFALIDEAQGLRDRASHQSRAARRLRHARRRLALTGTPIDKDPIEIWAQMRFVDVNVFGDNFTVFAGEFCRRGGYKDKQWIFRDKFLPQFLQRCAPCVSRLQKTFMNLPPCTVHLLGVPLLGKQEAIYKAMAKHGIATVDEIKIAAPLAVTRQAKLEQITGGTILDEDGTVHLVGNAKQRKLRSLIKKLPKPVVIFCKYLAEIPIIEFALPSPARIMTGAVKDTKKGRDRTDLINAFQAGKVDYLICQMRTGGVSIELTRAHTLIFYSMNFSLIDFEQVIGRFHRGGQRHPVDVYVIFSAGTVDEKIIAEIESKHDTFYKVINFFAAAS